MNTQDDFTSQLPRSGDILNGFPGGLVIYRMHHEDIQAVFRNDAYFQLMGFSDNHIAAIRQGKTFVGVHPEDLLSLQEKTAEFLKSGDELAHIFRVFHDKNHCYHWYRITGSKQYAEDGSTLLYAVYTNITDLQKIQLEMNHLINSSSGGVASYRIENGQLIPSFCSDGIASLFGYTKEEFTLLMNENLFNIIYAGDFLRVKNAVAEAVQTGNTVKISYRVHCKNGNLIWAHLNGQRIGSLEESSKFYASISGMSEDSKMYQEIAAEAADAVYVIDRKNYEILYFYESKKIFPNTEDCMSKRCYEVLQGQNVACPFCNFQNGQAKEDTEVVSQWNDKVYRMHMKETVWNGIPAFIQYLHDVTDEVKIRQEKQRLEQYFQTLVQNLPGGVAVVRYRKDRSFIPEFLSSGFADMTKTTLEQAKETYHQNALSGVHPEDTALLKKQLHEAFMNPDRRYELTYRLICGNGEYIWVRNTLSMLPDESGDLRQYCYIRDITGEYKEQEQLREQYQKLIVQHYRTPGPNVLVVGHCNISQNKILEINDYTGSNALEEYSSNREEFFKNVSDLIMQPEMRKKFLDIYLNEPMLNAYKMKQTEQTLSCLIQLPGDKTGRYAKFNVHLLAEPDSGNITGILTVTDITEQVVSEQVLEKLSLAGYDYVIVLDLITEQYRVFASDERSHYIPNPDGTHAERIKDMLKNYVLPKDKENYKTLLSPAYIEKRLKNESVYTFDFSVSDEDGSIHVKRMTIFAIDLSIGRVGLSRTDVTETVREQQSLLNMLAYTFEMASFIDIGTRRMTMYTRQTVLEDLPAFVMEDYDTQIQKGLGAYEVEGQSLEKIRQMFLLDNMLGQLEQHPLGYDFVCAYQNKDGLRYKKINILWGDRTCRTVCIVRADVTDMLAEERNHKTELENALDFAKKASQAKSDFLSAMSHDIRTPMNAIMGMTALAMYRTTDPDYVAECLNKISLSSKHLLNLINDVLDMSKIEHARIELNHEYIVLKTLIEQVFNMLKPQATEKNQDFDLSFGDISHCCFYGDSLRLNQILINILANAVKFTPEGGSVELQVKEVPSTDNYVKYAFSIRDTGIGMSADMLENIFEPFARSTHVNRVEGTGLGLSITKGLVDCMGGSITVESTEGKGTQFYIQLEFEEAQEELIAAEEKSLSQVTSENSQFLHGRRFLIAEDNEINSEILQSLLEMHGAVSEVKVNGIQAVKAFCENPIGTYDAILMDVQMPEMNGYEATRSIRALKRTDALTIPIIAMTANAFAEDVQAALSAGMNAHVAKPIDMDVLIETLQKKLL